MRLTSLVDIRTNIVISVDAEALLLRLEIDGAVHEIRVKPYHAEILYFLFQRHPTPVSYQEMMDLLKKHHLSVYDVTRMHRKISEVRGFLSNFHSSLRELIVNTRGVGYGLLLNLKQIHVKEEERCIAFKNDNIVAALASMQQLIQKAILLTSESKIVKHHWGFIIYREPYRKILDKNISLFNRAADVISKEIRVHDADFLNIRIQYLLAKLRTYIGLGRISEYSISAVQWNDWFQQEVWALFDDLQKWIKSTQN